MRRFRTYGAYLLYVAKINWKSTLMLGIETTLFLSLVFSINYIQVLNNPNFFHNIALSLVTSYLGVKLIYKSIKVSMNIFRMVSIRHDLSIEQANTLLRRGPGEFYYSDVAPCEHDVAQEFQKEDFELKGLQQPVFRSARLDEMLRLDNDFSLIKSKDKIKTIHSIIRQRNETYLTILRYYTSQAINNNTLFFNERKFCFSGDFDFQHRSISYHRGTYFDSVLTNILYSQIVSEGFRDNKRMYFDGTGSFPVFCTDDNRTVLQSLSLSPVNNHVGVSTIAFTDDGYMVIYCQGRDTYLDSGLLVASGNGSCDWSDVRGKSLLNTIKYAMERELKEEGFIAKENRLVTKVLGYFRWIRLAGKPQFVGITRMRGVKYDSIKAQEGSKLDLGFDNCVLRQDRLPELVNSLLKREDLSIGLAIALKCLHEYIARDKDSLESFLYPFDT